MSSQPSSQPAVHRALNKAMREAVDFIHAEGWDAPPTLFALVPTELVAAQLGDVDDSSPLTLVVQELPEGIEPGSEHLADYVSRLAWPQEIAGVILAQEIMFKDTSDAALGDARPARLFSGVLRATAMDGSSTVDAEELDENGAELTLLQLRPTEEELAEAGPFAEDDIQLRGGPNVAPGVIAALRYGLEQDPEEIL
ncbi:MULTISPECIES: PPA1309 family protein [Corynebacterium]|uniref:PPA1309 family protein n=1 Tax=Corynebacterium intestinale TaxID=2943492 RepID=A0ABT0TBE2_9CORY|nr:MULTISPECIES: PPA1309 family protein [Corynebacterium]MCL8494408.1 PPA1309 family protein [Corynebacterium intestinale]MCP1390644.1 PPA1309 family protein [Corynebacterium intestinale]MCZ9297927.1 PPA1309 family protein [Corynebacterium hesseae]